MKNIFKFSALALMAAALFASCAKEIDTNPVKERIIKTFTLEMATPDSKVAIADNGKSTWEAGDEIYIHGKIPQESKTVTLKAEDISADGKKAKIQVDVTGITPYDPDQYYACYPADAVGYSGDRAYYYGEFNNTNRPLMAAYLEGEAFKFYNICGVISFKVSGDFDSYVFKGNADEVVGYEFYQVKVNSEEQNYKRTATGELKEISGAISSGAGQVCFPNGVSLSKGFTILFKKGDAILKQAVSETAVEIPRNGILALGDISSHLEDYVPTEDPIEHEKARDLSMNGGAAANCYIVTEPGIYKFPAVKGNSQESAGTVASVEVIWETYNNDESVTAKSVIAKADCDEKNWVYIQTPETITPGNALVAAKDESGKIIWSWHIWIPSTTIATGTYGIFGVDAMDRNLGALVAATVGSPAPVESFGLSFQWGRKDAFVGPASTSGSSNAKVAGTGPTAAEATITLEESIQNPTVLGMTADGDWLTETNNTLWQNEVKTIYDPCPAGYRVPVNDAEPFKVDADLSALTGWEEDATNGYFLLGDPSAVFPFAGYRDDWSPGGFTRVYQRVAYWTAGTDSDSKGYVLNVRNASAGNTHAVGGAPKTRGGYVRCVKSDEVLEPLIPAVVGANGVELDTNGAISSDWSKAELVTDNNGGILEWKYGFDSDNLYFYFKIARSSIKSEKENPSFRKRRYIWMGFDTDNDPATGVNPEHDLTITGCEARALVYPFTGTAAAVNSTEGTLEVINGLDDRSQTEVLVDPTSKTEDNIYVYGNVTGDTSEDLVYIEMSVPRAGLGISSSFTGYMTVQFSLSGDTTESAVIKLK